MGDESLNVAAFQVIPRQQLFADFGLLAYRKFEYSLTILVNEVHFFIDRLVGRGMQTSSARHVEGTPTSAIDFVHEVNHAD